MAGTLFVVATPIGNLEDISARALRVLREVALIAAEDTRRTSKLLLRHGISTPSTSLHAHNEHQKRTELVARLEGGDNVALVSDAGTPTIADPGGLLIEAAVAKGLRIEPIPGPSAITTLLSVAGFASTTFSFLGFPPTSRTERADWFKRVRQIGGLVVFYEAPHRIKFTLEDLVRAVGDVPVVVGRELTKAHEEILRGSANQVLARLESPIGEFAVAVNIGRTTDSKEKLELSPALARSIFGQLTDSGLTRRGAIAKLSRDYNRTARQVFDLLEQAKDSAR